MGYKQRRARTPANKQDRNYEKVEVYLPRSVFDIVKVKADAAGLPVSRLITYAVDNEICEGADQAFEYPCEQPTVIFVEGAYTDEAQRIYQYLVKAGPHAIDQIMLCRRDIGVPEKKTLMLAIRELLSRTGLTDQVYPSWARFVYPKGYRVISTITSSQEQKNRKIQTLETQLKKLKGEDNE